VASLRDTLSALDARIELLATKEKVNSDEMTAIHASVKQVDQGINQIRDSSSINLPLNASQLHQAT